MFVAIQPASSRQGRQEGSRPIQKIQRCDPGSLNDVRTEHHSSAGESSRLKHLRSHTAAACGTWHLDLAASILHDAAAGSLPCAHLHSACRAGLDRRCEEGKQQENRTELMQRLHSRSVHLMRIHSCRKWSSPRWRIRAGARRKFTEAPYATGWAQYLQRLAGMGMSLRHSGQVLVVAAWGPFSRFTICCAGRTMMK